MIHLDVLACECGGVDEITARCLKQAGVKDYLKIPIQKGRKAADLWFSQLPSQIQQNLETWALMAMIEYESSYIAIVAWNEKGLVWADIASGDSAADWIDGVTIAKTFAEN